MRTAVVIGYGQIGARIVADLLQQGVETTVVTRAAEAPVPQGARHVIGDAGHRTQIADAAAGAEVIFACFHARYDSRVWRDVLPGLEQVVLDVAAEQDGVVIFPESTYAFAARAEELRDDAGFAPAEGKGRVRQELLEARAAHPARALSVLAGDLIGPDAAPATSVVRMMITDRVAAGRRPVIPADPEVPHALTDVGDLSGAMIHAAKFAEEILRDGEGQHTHRLLIAPSHAPTLREVVEHAAHAAGQPARTPWVLPHGLLMLLGAVSRTALELSRLRPLWRRRCVLIPSAQFEEAVARTPWRRSVEGMIRASRDGVPA